MVDYTFTTDRGWRVTEYRPFSLSYAVLHTPGFYGHPSASVATAYNWPAAAPEMTGPLAGSEDLLTRLTDQRLRFDYFSVDVLRQLLQERLSIRDRNRSSILGRITDVSGEIYSASVVRTPDADKRTQGLERLKLDLERQLRDEDVNLWRDLVELRRELITADKQYQSTQLRSTLFAPAGIHDGKYQGQGDTGIPG